MSTQEGAGGMEKESGTTRGTGGKPRKWAERNLSERRKVARLALPLRQRRDRAKKRENRDENVVFRLFASQRLSCVCVLFGCGCCFLKVVYKLCGFILLSGTVLFVNC